MKKDSQRIIPGESLSKSRNLLKNHNCSFLQRQTTIWFRADIFTCGTVLEYKIRPVNNVNHRNIHLAISIHDDISALDFLPDLGGIEKRRYSVLKII